MAQAHSAAPATLIAGLLAGGGEWLELAIGALVARFGPIDLRSDVIPFTFTGYYDRDMGTGLLRQFVAFAHPVDPATLADVKTATNALEIELAARLAAEVPRPVNIDPGYLTDAKLVLASAKDFSHRLYLRDGIYAEITLSYKKGALTHFEWTFPDFRTEVYKQFFEKVRTVYMRQVKNL